MSMSKSGRHRAPGHLNPAFSLSTAISSSAKPAAQAGGVIAICGVMVASFALPASAATTAMKVTVTSPTAATGVLAIAAPSAAQAPLVTTAFGSIDFRGLTKPKPVVQPVATAAQTPAQTPDRSADRSSRSSTRVPAATATAAPVNRSGGVLGIAESLNGIYYVYGGTTPAGFDCSGFTQYVFGQMGMSLPRTAEQQRQATTPVTDPEVGDLVFFGAPAYHNGIYAGNGMLWDSPKTGSQVSLRSIWTTSGVTYGRVS